MEETKMIEIRGITEEERSAYEKLHRYSFGHWSDEKITEENIEHILTKEVYGVFEKGELKSTMLLLNFQQSIRGVLKGMGGISDVGTYPEARRKGYARELMKTAFSEMRKKNLPVSMLKPFKESFYARYGYVSASDSLKLTAPLQSLRDFSDLTLNGKWKIERVPAVKAKNKYLKFVNNICPARYNGFVINPNFTDAIWKRRNKDTLIVFVIKNGEVEALARYSFEGWMHSQRISKITIHEMYWRTVAGQAALFNFLGKHKDQTVEVHINLPFSSRYQHWFVDLPKKIEIRAWNPWMVRVVIVDEALTGLPISQPGKLTIKVTDPHCDWNNETYKFQTEDGRLEVRGTKKEPSIEATIEALSALTYGTHTIEALEYAGWLKILANHARPILKEWFPILPFYNAYNF